MPSGRVDAWPFLILVSADLAPSTMLRMVPLPRYAGEDKEADVVAADRAFPDQVRDRPLPQGERVSQLFR